MGELLQTDIVERVTAAFEENFNSRGEIGASVSIYHDGEEVLSLAHGMTHAREGGEWTAETLVPIFSATKGPSSACVLMALYEQGLDAETEMGRLWPRFPAPEATVAEVLSHQIGLAALDEEVFIEDHDAIVEAINRQRPAWMPPRHGYHARMFGPLAEELVRLLTGKTLSMYWEDRFRKPLNLALWIGLPQSEDGRVARLYPGKAVGGELSKPFYKEYLTRGSFIHRVFYSPVGFQNVQDMNKPSAWRGGFPALGGVATASALAEFYQVCLGKGRGREIIPASVREMMYTMQASGMDEVIREETAFSCGFMMDPVNADGEKTRALYGPCREAFGHPGAGGSIGLADPSTGVSFAYTMNQMELGVLPGEKPQNLLKALFGCGYESLQRVQWERM